MAKAVVGIRPLTNDPRIAGVRIRCLEPLRVMRQRKLPVELFDADRANQYQVVVFQKSYDPASVELARTLSAHGTRIVFDMCDNHLTPDRGVMEEGQKQSLQQMLDIADVISVSSQPLVQCYGDKAVLIRDGISRPPLWAGLAGAALRKKPSKQIELVWHGHTAVNSAGNAGMLNILHIADLLQELSRKFALRLTVIGNARHIYQQSIEPLPFPTRFIEWGNYARSSAFLATHDICIIPIEKNTFTICKSHNRLTLPLYLGVPVVADSIPAYEEFSSFTMLDDWNNGLRRYCEDKALRKQHACLGRQYVQNHYQVEHAARDWWTLFESLLSEGAPHNK